MRELEVPVSVHDSDRAAPADRIVVANLSRHLPTVDETSSTAGKMQKPVSAGQRDRRARRQALLNVDEGLVNEAGLIANSSKGGPGEAGRPAAPVTKTASESAAPAETATTQTTSPETARGSGKSERAVGKIAGRIPQVQRTPAPQEALIEIQGVNLRGIDNVVVVDRSPAHIAEGRAIATPQPLQVKSTL